MYNVKFIDWDQYLERKQPLFLMAAFIRPYGTLLQTATGFRFDHQLHSFKGETGIFYRSKHEMEAADRYYLELVRRNDSRLQHWKERGLLANQKANSLIDLFSNFDIEIDSNTFWDYLSTCEEILVFDTVIPYRVLSAINSGLEEGDSTENYTAALELFEPFRAKARYPEIVKLIFPAFWKAAARLLSIEDIELLSLATPLELKALFENGTRMEVGELKKRREGCVFWEDPETSLIHFSYEDAIWDEIGISQKNLTLKELKGTPAYNGKARGTVKIINEISDIKNFEVGDILVTINSNPSLMPALAKASGIISDEGGIMCHAAIISRELKKPCIIGTKIATKILKDGDVVELDGYSGTVTKV